jgi:hypothetical protein
MTDAGTHEPGETKSVDELFTAITAIGDELRETVNSVLGEPIYPAVSALDSASLLQALKQVEASDRRSLLGRLGLHGGAAPGKPIADLGLMRLRQADPHLQRWAAWVLAGPVWSCPTARAATS